MKSPDIDFWVSAIDEAMSFAVLPADQPNAEHEAGLGLIEEAGEVAGLFKRQMRGDNSGELDKEKLARELGDLWWYTVRFQMVSSRRTAHDLAAFFLEVEKNRDRPYLLQDVLGVLNGFSTAGFWWQMIHLHRLARLAGMSLREIVSLNLEKLRARKQAGTILGSGDNR